MKRSIFSFVGIIVSLVAIVFFIFACGGGSSESSGPNPKVSSITGVAAAGAPIFGSVYVKDAEGKILSVEINADGSYYLDVSNLTPPYILYAEGIANWESIKIYSAGFSCGNINVTPITDLILRTALSGDAESAFSGWNSGILTSEALAAAETQVQQQLQPLLNAAGIPADINLICSSFNADHTGLDIVLDSITISYDSTGTIVTVTNNLTGFSYTNDLTTTDDDADIGFPPSDEDLCKNALTDVEAISQVWQVLIDLYADSVPMQEELNSIWAPHIADDYLNGGISKSEELDMWGTGSGGPCVGFKVAVTLKRVLLQSELVGESHTYEKGYMINSYYSDNCDNSNINTTMVYDGTKWMLFGNRMWLSNFGPKDRATMRVYPSGDQEFFTGLGLNICDSVSNYAYSQGVRSAIVAGPGLPARGIILEHTYPGHKFNIYPDQESPCGHFGDEWCLTDNIISNIPDNAAYVTYLFAEDAETLAADADPINNYFSKKYGTTLNNRPYLNSELTASMFPTIVSPVPPALSGLNIPGQLEVIWTNTDSSTVKSVTLQWDDGISYISKQFNIEDCETASSATFDTTGLNPPINWANIHMSAFDTFGRSIDVSWDFE